VEQIAHRQSDAVPFADGVERTIERLRHPSLGKHLLVVDDQRDADAVVPALIIDVAGRLKVEAVGVPPDHRAPYQAPRLGLARLSSTQTLFLGGHAEAGGRPDLVTHALNDLSAALGVGPAVRARRCASGKHAEHRSDGKNASSHALHGPGWVQVPGPVTRSVIARFASA
jgi:hypothetical protein